MIIDKQYLTVSNYNRPGIRRDRTTAVACHYIGNPGTSARQIETTLKTCVSLTPQRQAATTSSDWMGRSSS